MSQLREEGIARHPSLTSPFTAPAGDLVSPSPASAWASSVMKWGGYAQWPAVPALRMVAGNDAPALGAFSRRGPGRRSHV